MRQSWLYVMTFRVLTWASCLAVFLNSIFYSWPAGLNLCVSLKLCLLWLYSSLRVMTIRQNHSHNYCKSPRVGICLGRNKAYTCLEILGKTHSFSKDTPSGFWPRCTIFDNYKMLQAYSTGILVFSPPPWKVVVNISVKILLYCNGDVNFWNIWQACTKM